MADPEKAVVKFPPRDRLIITENDLETNSGLIKEVTLACFEQVLQLPDPSDGKEIPNLSEKVQCLKSIIVQFRKIRDEKVVNVLIDGAGVWSDSQPDAARPARAHATLAPPAGGPEPSLKPAESLVSAPGTPDLDAASVEATKSPVEKPRKRLRAAAKQECLISNPPKLSPNLEKVAHEVSKPLASDGGTVDVNLEDQRSLKKKLEDEAKEEALEKKQLAMEKKQKAALQAVAKAQKKLQAAQAKAAQLQNSPRRRGTKRNLQSEFQAAAASKDPAEAESPARSGKTSKRQHPKLSPKAKAFAANSTSPTKAASARKDKATESLATLRSLQLVDLPLPSEDFNKKQPGCN
eukprot:s1851_g16.t1